MENPNPEARDRTGVIDVIAENPKTGEVVLVMNEPNEWVSSDEELLGLQERFNAYVSSLHLVIERGALDTEKFRCFFLVAVAFCKRLNDRGSLDVVESLHAGPR